MAKILIMDDEPGLRNVMYNILKPTGHTLFLAEDGAQAIEIARKEKPDLAMLDIRVPDYDGLEVLAELKKMDPNIKGVMISGFGDVESAVGAMKKAFSNETELLMVAIMLVCASAGSQLGATATRLADPAHTRILFGATVLSGSVAMGLEQASQSFPDGG